MLCTLHEIGILIRYSHAKLLRVRGVVFLCLPRDHTALRAHVCLLLFVVASPVARRSRACSQLALPPCRTLAAWQLPMYRRTWPSPRYRERPPPTPLGHAQRQYWSHATGIDDDGEVFVQARNISDDAFLGDNARSESLLSRCPNCYTYGLRKVTSRGKECSHCLWLEPSHADAAPVPSGRLPKLSPRYTPRPTVSDVSVEELRLALEQARAPFQQKYTKLPRRNRVDGAASRITEPVYSLPTTSRKANASQEPLPWLAGRGTPPPSPPVAAKRAADRAAAEEAQRQAELAAYVPPPPPRPPSPWPLEQSIWWSRRKWSDGKSLYDSDRVLKRAMEVDWSRAIDAGLMKHVLCDYEGRGRTEAELEPEIEEIKLALVANARAIYSLFDFYASLGSSGNFTVIGFNAYKQFVTDNALAIDRSKHCDDSMLDQLFVQVNSAGAVAAAAAARAGGKKQQGSRAFARSETLHMLVRVAISRYILDGTETDVSQAVCSLCEHLQTHLVPQAKQSADDFRRSYCYIEGVSRLLASHKRSLRAIFEVYADFPNVKPTDAKLLAFDDWILFLRHLNFFDEAFQQREGTLAFVFSRLRCIDEESERGKKRLENLSFQDFLEAIVRCSTMKALPTRTELLLAGAPDAGTFLVNLRSNPSAYKSFVEERERAWDAPLRQPIERCVESMIALIIRTIEMSTGMSGGDFQLSKAELTRFYKQGGARLAANTSARKQAAGSAEDAPRKASSSDNTTVAPSLANMIRTNSEQRAQAPGFLKPAMEMRAMKWGSKARAANATHQQPAAGGVRDALKALTSGTAGLTEVGQLGS